jgi:uncharacterized RDD family membrane protein YckC
VVTDLTDRSGAGALHGHRAGFASRVAAATIDLGAVLLLCLGTLLVAGLVQYLVAGPPFGLPSLPRWSGAASGTAIAVAYLTCGWSTAGRTAGMQVLGLRLVCGTGSPLPFGRSLLRALLCVAFPAGLLWTLVSRRNASVQDLVVRSAVIYDWSYRSSKRRASATGATSDRDDIGPVIRR